MTIRDIAIAIGYKVDDKSYKKAVSSTGDFIKGVQKGIKSVKAALVALLAGTLTQMIEQYDTINAQLAYATDYLGDQLALQNEITKAAEASRTSYAGMAGIVKNMVQDTNSWTLSTEEAVDYAERMTKVFRGAGLSRDASASMVQQFSQGFQNGRLTNLPQMLQQAPELINYLAKSLNMSTDAVKALASAGAISLKQFTQAIYENTEDIEKRFKQIPTSLSEIFATLKERLGVILSQINQQFKIFDSIKEVFDVRSQFSRAMESYGIDPGEKESELLSFFESLKPGIDAIVTSVKEIAGGLIRSAITTIVDFITQNKDLIKSIFQIVTDILGILEVVMPAIEAIAELVTRLINWVISVIGKAITWLLNAIHKVLDKLGIAGRFEASTAEATKEIAKEVTQPATISNVGGDKTVTILVNNDYTFNGADRSAQKEAVNYVRKGAEEIYTDLKLSLNYAG